MSRSVPADPVLTGYIEDADRAVPAINADSPLVTLARAPDAGVPPFLYRGILAGVEHFVRVSDGTFRVSSSPLLFEIEIEQDFCRSSDRHLQFRVLRTSSLLVHPNVSSGICCLGTRFRPATKLRSIVELFYRIASGRIAATDDPFDPVSAEFFLSHPSEVRALRAPPLWSRPTAREVRVEPAAGPASAGEGRS
jgi:hypothetical protein